MSGSIPRESVRLITTDARYATFYTNGGVWVYDKETGKLEFKPEMPILEHAGALLAATELLSRTEGMKGVEELQLQAAKFATDQIAKIAKNAISPKAARAVA